MYRFRKKVFVFFLSKLFSFPLLNIFVASECFFLFRSFFFLPFFIFYSYMLFIIMLREFLFWISRSTIMFIVRIYISYFNNNPCFFLLLLSLTYSGLKFTKILILIRTCIETKSLLVHSLFDLIYTSFFWCVKFNLHSLINRSMRISLLSNVWIRCFVSIYLKNSQQWFSILKTYVTSVSFLYQNDCSSLRDNYIIYKYVVHLQIYTFLDILVMELDSLYVMWEA